MVHLSHPYMTTRKAIALTIWTFVDKVMSLLLNMLSRFVIAFLPKRKVKVKVLVTQLCLTLCDPVDYSPPGFSVHVILQARILEWVVSPSPGDLPDPGIEPGSSALRRFFTI